MRFSRKLLEFVVGTTLYLLPITSSQAQPGQVLYYGGDYDGVDGAPSMWAPNLQDLIFDEFGLSQNSDLQAIWGNFGLVQTVDYFIPTQAYCEIRSGVSAGNGGTLLFSGFLSVQDTPTGRSQYGLPEYQVLADLNLTLPAGIYWLGMAPVGSSIWDEAYISSTSCNEDNTPGDPNPPPTGYPLTGGISYQDGPAPNYNFMPIAQEFSYGVGGSVVPEPSMLSLLAVSIIVFSVFLRCRQMS
jgi:hypothetical protein